MNQSGGERNIEFSQREKEQAQWAMRNIFLSFMKKKLSTLSGNLYILPDSENVQLGLKSTVTRTQSVTILFIIYRFFLFNIKGKEGLHYRDAFFEYELSKEVFRDMFGECVRNLICSNMHLSIFPCIGSRQTTVEEYHTWLRDLFGIDMTSQVVATTDAGVLGLLHG